MPILLLLQLIVGGLYIYFLRNVSQKVAFVIFTKKEYISFHFIPFHFI